MVPVVIFIHLCQKFRVKMIRDHEAGIPVGGIIIDGFRCRDLPAGTGFNSMNVCIVKVLFFHMFIVLL